MRSTQETCSVKLFAFQRTKVLDQLPANSERREDKIQVNCNKCICIYVYQRLIRMGWQDYSCSIMQSEVNFVENPNKAHCCTIIYQNVKNEYKLHMDLYIKWVGFVFEVSVDQGTYLLGWFYCLAHYFTSTITHNCHIWYKIQSMIDKWTTECESFASRGSRILNHFEWFSIIQIH